MSSQHRALVAQAFLLLQLPRVRLRLEPAPAVIALVHPARHNHTYQSYAIPCVAVIFIVESLCRRPSFRERRCMHAGPVSTPVISSMRLHGARAFARVFVSSPSYRMRCGSEDGMLSTINEEANLRLRRATSTPWPLRLSAAPQPPIAVRAGSASCEQTSLRQPRSAFASVIWLVSSK